MQKYYEVKENPEEDSTGSNLHAPDRLTKRGAVLRRRGTIEMAVTKKKPALIKSEQLVRRERTQPFYETPS